MNEPSNRTAVASILIGILVVSGIGLVGATIDSMELVGANESDVGGQPTPTAIEGPNGSPGGPVDPSNVTAGGGQEDSLGGLSQCIEPLSSTPGTALVVLGFLGLVGLVFHRYNFSAALLVGWTIMPPLALVYFLLTNCADGGGGPPGDGPGLPGSDLALDVSSNIPPWAILGLVGVLLLAAVGLMYRSVGEEEVVPIEEETDEDADLDEFAEAAGRAADRIEEHDVDVDNAVYRAWVEMTQLLDVDDPDTYSAGDFATVAIGLGMAEDDVTELTRLFNEVRYGDKDAETRADRALSVLRTIEREYGTDEAAEHQGDPDEGDAEDSTDAVDESTGSPDDDSEAGE